MMIRFSEDGNTETKQSAQATVEHADRFGALARADSWYDHAMAIDPIVLNLRRRLNKRRRDRQNYLPLACEVRCVKMTAAGRQQNAPEGVTSEEKASLGASW